LQVKATLFPKKTRRKKDKMTGRARFTGHALPSPPRSPWRSPSPREAKNEHLQMPLSSSSPSKSWDEGDERPCSVRISPRPTEQPFVVPVWTDDDDEPPVTKKKPNTTPSSPATTKSDSWDSASVSSEQDRSSLSLRRALEDVLEQRDKAMAQQERLMELRSLDKLKIESLVKEREILTLKLQEQKQKGNFETVQKKLEEKTQALESAKMIITSLESASGSQIADLRQKVRDRQAQILRLEANLHEKQRTIDTLAIELRDSGMAAAVPRQVVERLEHNLAHIRSEAVVLEATQDAASVTKLCDYLGDAILALKEGLECFSSVSSSQSSADSSNEHELQQKNTRIQQLENELHQLKDELKSSRLSNRKAENEELQSLRSEVQCLREKNTTNMAILAKKEKELSVLRDSLKVDDDDGGVGYISDDAEDEDDAPQPSTSQLITSSELISLSQIEALATLLAHGVPVERHNTDMQLDEIELIKSQLQELTSEKERALAELKIERESLANAKMIISSLENANKSMMQDLRTRLQDSNVAIASLLQKSLGSENTTAQLRSELETLKREREQDRERYQKELDRLRTESWTPHLLVRQDDQMITETID
jgi:HAMP domain-containing protein